MTPTTKACPLCGAPCRSVGECAWGCTVCEWAWRLPGTNPATRDDTLDAIDCLNLAEMYGRMCRGALGKGLRIDWEHAAVAFAERAGHYAALYAQRRREDETRYAREMQ